MKNTLTLIFFLTIDILSTQKNPQKQPVELGKVNWNRDYYQAVENAKNEEKGILILFQEVPGCATCQHYGSKALSHPLIVEAIESEFVPLAIFNNNEGHDAEILSLYNEPSWNNPVVRIVSANGTNLVPRVSGDYSSKGLVNAMRAALIRQNRPIPEYLNLLNEELSKISKKKAETEYFKMYCFWSGEKHFGKAQGVVSAKAGFMGGNEVVKVQYDPNFIDREELIEYAKKGKCQSVKNSGFRFSNKDHLFYLRGTEYKYLPLTEFQKIKINTALGSHQDPQAYLSPQQKVWLQQTQNNQIKKIELIDEDINSAWWVRKRLSE